CPFPVRLRRVAMVAFSRFQLLTAAGAFAMALAIGAPAAMAHDGDGNPPGWRGGPGTNWENPPGWRGGPGTSPDRRWRWWR
ncbi:MAG: hypothetical protein AB7O63_17320, partial [Reyranellaceae bacterium]